MAYLLSVRFWIVAAAIALLGVSHFTAYRSGKAVVRAQWNEERIQGAVEQAVAERLARSEEKRRAKETQRILEESAVREAALRARAAGAERAVVSLRDEIARLNGRPAPANAEAAGHAHEARVARELLGACSKEYGSLAAEADGLRDQVIGLQDWVGHVVAK